MNEFMEETVTGSTITVIWYCSSVWYWQLEVCVHSCASEWRNTVSRYHFTQAPLMVQSTCGPGTEWYDIPASDLLSHCVFVLLYLQTIHCTDLSGEKSAPQAWMMASIPASSCWLRIPVQSRGPRLTFLSGVIFDPPPPVTVSLQTFRKHNKLQQWCVETPETGRWRWLA